MKKRSVSLVIVIAMVLSLLSPAACQKVAAADVTGKFYHASEIYLTKDYKATYYYTDSYFNKASTTYQDSLATMSMCLAMSAFRSNRAEDYTAEKAQNLKALLKNCGFTNFKTNGYASEPTQNTTATGIASKKITVDGTKYTLIALAISGGRIGEEWGGVLRLGKSGNAENGQAGADKALKFLENYIEDQEITGNVKLWITGYGVAAGKANLLAGTIDEAIENEEKIGAVKLQKKNVYAYCFQTPKLALTSHDLDSSTYNNIFNICNPYNFMVQLAPDQYKLGRYGVDKCTPTEGTDSQYRSKRNDMIEKMEAMDGSIDYIIDDFQMKKIDIFGEGFVGDGDSSIDLAEFLDSFIDNMTASCATTRSVYADDYEDDAAQLLSVMMGNSDENWEDCMNIFVSKIQNNILPLGIDMVLGNESNLRNSFEEYAREAVDKAGVENITDNDIETFARVLAKLAVEFALDYPDATVTFFYNMLPMMTTNDPVMNLAWLQSVDDYYNGEKKLANTITASNITKTVSSSAREVEIGAKAKGSAKLSYKSNNDNIKVSSKGVVTIKKNYVGKATITITSAETSTYKKTTKKITVTAKPVKATINSLTYKSSKLTIKNKKNIGGVKYEIWYATNSDFKNKKTAKVSYNSKGYSIKNPTKGKTYYVKMRGYKVVNDVTINGTFSDVKKIKIK